MSDWPIAMKVFWVAGGFAGLVAAAWTAWRERR